MKWGKRWVPEPACTWSEFFWEGLADNFLRLRMFYYNCRLLLPAEFLIREPVLLWIEAMWKDWEKVGKKYSDCKEKNNNYHIQTADLHWKDSSNTSNYLHKQKKSLNLWAPVTPSHQRSKRLKAAQIIQKNQLMICNRTGVAIICLWYCWQITFHDFHDGTLFSLFNARIALHDATMLIYNAKVITWSWFWVRVEWP